MIRNHQLRVVIVGRDVSIAPLEQVLLAEGASNYICAPTLDAADWLVRDGFDADLLIVHTALLTDPSDLLDMRRRVPHAVVLPTSAHCDSGELSAALLAAGRSRAQALSHCARSSLVESIGVRLALG